MERITIEEFDLTHGSQEISEEDFDLLSQLALDTVDELCFGRASRNKDAARRAMKELISLWIARGGRSGVCGPADPKSETVGNYSVTHRDEHLMTVHGITVSPAALMILNSAGLRERAV